MKNWLLVIGIAVMLQSCNNKNIHVTDYLTNEQIAFLHTPPNNSILIFNDNNIIDTVKLKSDETYLVQDYYSKAGMLTTPEEIYYHQQGNVGYENMNVNKVFNLSLNACSKVSYHNKASGSTQSVSILNADKTNIVFGIDFNKTLPSCTIGGKNYIDVVYSVSNQDTLFWKKDIGILGWTKKASGYTVYRVF